MTKHTDEAVKAAKGIWKDGKITLHSDTDYHAFIESATAIIDDKTGLPRLKAHLDNLELETDGWTKTVILMGKATRELKAERDGLLGILKRLDAWARELPQSEHMADILKDARKALDIHHYIVPED